MVFSFHGDIPLDTLRLLDRNSNNFRMTLRHSPLFMPRRNTKKMNPPRSQAV
jgi:hypothetical protein